MSTSRSDARGMRSGALVTAALLLGATTAEAGIIVLETGDTIVGRIEPKDLFPDKVVVRWPHGDLREKGQLDVRRERIRWMDVDADAPTDAYWKAHLDLPIEVRWAGEREAYITRQKQPTGDLIEIPVEPLPPDPLVAQPIEQPDFRLRKPVDWAVSLPTRDDRILVITAPRGTRARIHVFAVDSPGAARTEQVVWIRDALAKFAKEGGEDSQFDVEELYRLKQVQGGADQLMVTKTRRGERAVRALRKVLFREGRTVFFAAYADERDYPEVEQLFHRVLGTLEFKVSP